MDPSDAPPLLLAVDTATRVMGVALLRGETLLAEIATEGPRPHSERLLPGIDRVLALAGAALHEVGAFAVSVGPGSFTGLRIGIATVKGFGLGDPRPVLGVPTLAALAAAAAGAPGPVAALLDARRGEVYAAAWAGVDLVLEAPLVAESVYTPEELAESLPPDCVLVAGEGALSAARRVNGLRASLRLATTGEVPARAERVGRLALALLARGEGAPADALVARYVRRAEAEVRRTGERVEGAAPGDATPEAL